MTARLLGVSLLLSLNLAATSAIANEEDTFNVPLTELMVNVPDASFDAELDALAQEYLRNAPRTASTPATAPERPAPPAKRKGPSTLNINEVFLSQEQWLSETHRQVELALANNDWPLAEGLLAQVVNEYPDAHESRLRLAALYYGRGAINQTRTLLQQGLERAPEQADFRLTLARLLAEEQRYPAALQVLSQANPELARHLDYYSLKAEMARRSDQCPLAIDTYQRLLSYGSAGGWWLGLGLCQRKLGENFSHAFREARASADLGQASLRFVEQQLEQYETTQAH